MHIDTTSRLGYAHPAYAQSLPHIGAQVPLTRCGGSLVSRPIPGTPHHDLLHPYPLFALQDWAGLADDLKGLGDEWITATVVTDPMSAPEESALRECFPDFLQPYKHHQVVDLTVPVHGAIHPSHRRKALRALAELTVERADNAADLIETWSALYAVLAERHTITGPAAFSREAFELQLRLPDIEAWTGSHDGRVISMILCMASTDTVYYHLGAHSAAGYAHNASFALFYKAIADYASRGWRWFDLGAGTGTTADALDGLSRFKRGWATDTRTAYLAGRIFSPELYARLSSRAQTQFFPAYRG